MLHQRIAVIALAIAMVAGIAVTIDLNEQASRKRLPRELPRLGDKDRVLLQNAKKHERMPALVMAWKALESGNRQWEAGRQDAALLEWEVVAHEYPGTDASLAAFSHIGQVARARGDTVGAINAFTSLVESVDPPEREMKLGDFDYDLYKHKACIELSDIYIESNDTRNAHKYAELALHVHRFADFCGPVVDSVHQSLELRIQSLKQAIEQDRTIRLKE